jgi:hypothetical protein
MDDKDKNVVEQIVDSVNDLVESIANTASEALEPATRSSGPKPKRQSVPDYEFPAPSRPNSVSTPVKRPAAEKKTQVAKNPVKNTAANSSSKQSENAKQLSKKRKSKR